jgi:alkyldihydroxyacetonephosphate synthase
MAIISREQIVKGLINILGKEQVITDEQVLKESSLDRYRKYEQACEVYTQPTPAAVVYIHSAEDVSEVLKFADNHEINVVPRTGHSAIEGGLETALKDSIVVDGSAMNKVIKVDKYNMQVTCQCGVPLQELDDMLREQGYTTGHSPQSKPLAQMGGLVATRSIGQFSTLYGGIEDMIVGLEAVFPNGKICKIKNVPRRAAGPDIRHIICGNEGALCFITEVTLKLFKWMPQNNRYIGYKLDDVHMKLGFDCLREVMVEGYKPSFARLYDASDAQQHFSSWLEEGKAILIWMAEGPQNITPAIEAGIKELMSRHSELEEVEPRLIEKWYSGLNWGPEEIAQEMEEIRATKNIGITTEVSGSWDNIYEIYRTACDRILEEVPDMTLMGGHSSHSYINGTNMYFVYYYNVVDCAPEEEINKYHDRINQIICEQVILYGGSIVHHHGLGKARAKYVTQEYGSSYYMLKTLKQAFDPNGIMNMGTLIPLRK